MPRITRSDIDEIIRKYSELMIKEAAPVSWTARELEMLQDPRLRSEAPELLAQHPERGGINIGESVLGAGAFVATDVALRKILSGGSKLLGAGAVGAATAGAAKAAALGAGVAGAEAAAVGTAASASAGVSGGAAAGAAALLPIAGWALAGAGIIAGLGIGGYYLVDWMRKTTNDVTALIDRINDLDYEETDAESTVNTWLVQLEQLKGVFSIPVLEGDKVEKAAQSGYQVAIFKKGLEVLDNIAESWPQVKPVLKDWTAGSSDPQEFEKTLGLVRTNYQTRLQQLEQTAHKLTAEVVDSIEGAGTLMQEVEALETQVKDLWAPPQYDEQEKKAIDFGKRLTQKKVGVDEVQEYLPILIGLRDDLKTKILPQAQKWNKARLAYVQDPPLSKRAVVLPKDPTPEATKGKTVKPERSEVARPTLPRSETVKDMQRYINSLAVALDVPMGARLMEDGIYGNKTAQAVVDFTKALADKDPAQFPEQAALVQELKKYGINETILLDVALMNKTPEYMNVLTNAIENIYSVHIGQKQRPMSQRQPSQTTQTQQQVPAGTCNWGKQNPSREEMLACFKQINTMIGGERTNLYDYAQQNLGMDDNEIFNLLHRLFPGWASKNWSIPNILDAMGNKYSVLG